MNKDRIFITGGGGMLASEFESFYRQNGCDIFAPTEQELDVTDLSLLEQAIAAYKPKYVFHTAAIFPDFGEDNVEISFKVNSWATKNLARLCQKINSNFVFISSCGLFGDEIKYYSEYDPVVLKTVYARSKYKGENLAAAECANTYIIRPGWLFGSGLHHKRNFVYQRYLEAIKTPILKTAGDKYGSPTYTGDLVKKIDEVLKTDQPGLYHITNGGGGTRADYVKRIIEGFNLKTKIEIVDSGSFPRRANVPSCEMLNNFNLKFLGIEPMSPWQEAIDKFISLMQKELKNA